jgi:hypothetical protein
MEEVTRRGGKKWGMENYSIESIREVVYREWRMEEMVNDVKERSDEGEVAWRISRK